MNQNEASVEPSIFQNGPRWKASVDQERQKILAERTKNIPSKSLKNISDPNENNVQVVDRSYLQRSFKAKLKSDQNLVTSTVKDFSLNPEQERAFRIIAHHSLEPNSEQLKMYLGGMGGTGKSQVIKALMEFFKNKNESHRIVVLGPTGSSAALINGSTYHSFLGINPGPNTAKKINEVKAKLEGVDYIFIDEVSMMSCQDMYKISAQLAKALNTSHLPYGGINIIFAGDFAQLPPVGGASLFSQAVGTQIHAGLKLAGQESAIGKALWHQITTVVILRQNMRQKTQSQQDAQLRTALVNMRYGKCTTEDIKFLRSLQAGKRAGQPQVSAKDFRNVSVICGRHTQKDEINKLGCQKFADETGQKLTHFYSVDKWGKEKDPATKTQWGKSKSASKLKHQSNEIDFDIKQEIWKLRHGATENLAGKLSLCIGMPVMIRNNDATELCITKGQEGFVVGWQAEKGPDGKRILDTLFVKLHRPAKVIQIPGLPENVVPLVKSTKTITCVFPSDLKESIERQQVNVLPNFAMTDYASQGKSKDFNVVHLSSCYSHMSYYTCLSRSTSAAGTIIMQGFEPSIITRGCSGYLRQEFREHEILDDLTRLAYENKLPDFIQGNTRNTLVRQYQQWKGEHFVPEKVDIALKWSEKDPMNLLPVVTDSAWQIIDKSKKNNLFKSNIVTTFIPAKGSKELKHKQDEIDDNLVIKKKIKSSLHSDLNSNCPIGLEWDNQNWSCAYDSLLVILYDIWKENPDEWTNNFKNINRHMQALAYKFQEVYEESVSLENIRDDIRTDLHNFDPNRFPMGRNSASVADLGITLLQSTNENAISQVYCTECDYSGIEYADQLGYIFNIEKSEASSTQKWLDNLEVPCRQICNECFYTLTHQIEYKEAPEILVLEYPHTNIKTSHKIKMKIQDEYKVLCLRGIIYHGNNHFCSRIISVDETIWYHDGITTGNNSIEDGHLSNMNYEDLKTCNGKRLVLAIYA